MLSLISLWKEIEHDKALLRYGGVLGLVEVLTSYFWYWFAQPPRNLLTLLTPKALSVCWPFLQNCDAVRVFDEQALYLWIYGIGILGLVTTCAYLAGKGVVAWWLHLTTVLLKVAFCLLDFRLRLNQHIMATWTAFCFLFCKNKRDTVRLMLCTFYFWAGVIKLNFEWMSGAALYKPLVPKWFFQGPMIPISCVFVVVMELFFVWALLSKDKKWVGFILVQLFLFYLESFWLVGFFYPILMFLLLSIVPLIATEGEDQDKKSLLQRFFAMRAPSSALLVMAAFTCCQFFCHLFPGNTSVTGEGRFSSLHMFDALVQCKVEYTIELDDGRVQRLPPIVPGLPSRTKCDPWVHLEGSRHICDSVLSAQYPEDELPALGLSIASRLGSEQDYVTIVNLNDLCYRFRSLPGFFPIVWGLDDGRDDTSKEKTEENHDATEDEEEHEYNELLLYKWWTHNDWIQPYHDTTSMFKALPNTSMFDLVPFFNVLLGQDGAQATNPKSSITTTPKPEL